MACQFLKLEHHLNSSYEKTWLKEQCSISRTELKVSMITFPAG
jgi:hypothetical protein